MISSVKDVQKDQLPVYCLASSTEWHCERSGERERERGGFMDFEIARRQSREAIGEENVQCAALMRLRVANE